MALTIRSTHEGESAAIAVVGEVDVSCADELRDALDTALAEGATSLIADLSEMPYIDSTGIGVLVGVAHRAKDAGATFAVVHPQRNVSRVLALLGVDGELGLRG